MAPVAASQRQRVIELDRKMTQSRIAGEGIGSALWKDTESFKMQNWTENNQ